MGAVQGEQDREWQTGGKENTTLKPEVHAQVHSLCPVIAGGEVELRKQIGRGLRRRKLRRDQVQVDLVARPRHAAPIDQRVAGHHPQVRPQVVAEIQTQSPAPR